MTIRHMILCFLVTAVTTASAESVQTFPDEALPGVSIGGNLPNSHESSGIVWHPGVQKFFLVSDEGTLSSMTESGSSVTNWKVKGDLEAVTVALPQSNYIYLGIEDPDSIREFNIATGTVTRTFELTDWMDGPDNAGLEALTFVPDTNDPEGGLFYAGLQDTGQIFIFRLPIRSSTTSTAVTCVRILDPVNGPAISDLAYIASQDVIYAVYDKTDILLAMTPDGTILNEWVLPGDGQEGVALKGNELYISEDYGGDGGDVIRYSPFAVIAQPDLDADGTVSLADFSLLAMEWAASGSGIGADINFDGTVDMADLAIMSARWLVGMQ